MTSCVACSASLYEAGTKKCQRDFSVNRELQKINLKKKRLEVEEEKEEGKKKNGIVSLKYTGILA